MSGANTGVPALVATPLAERVPISEYEACPVTELFRRFGDKWTLLILVLLGGRPHRYNELHHRIEGISQRMLTRTLTASGQALLGPLSEVATWAVEHHASATSLTLPADRPE